MRILQDFDGQFLQADAYAGYDGILEGLPAEKVGCMAHARRKVVEAIPSDPARARVVLTLIQGLYKVEDFARTRNLGPEAIQALRQQHSAPLFAERGRTIGATPPLEGLKW